MLQALTQLFVYVWYVVNFKGYFVACRQLGTLVVYSRKWAQLFPVALGSWFHHVVVNGKFRKHGKYKFYVCLAQPC